MDSSTDLNNPSTITVSVTKKKSGFLVDTSVMGQQEPLTLTHGHGGYTTNYVTLEHGMMELRLLTGKQAMYFRTFSSPKGDGYVLSIGSGQLGYSDVTKQKTTGCGDSE